MQIRRSSFTGTPADAPATRDVFHCDAAWVVRSPAAVDRYTDDARETAGNAVDMPDPERRNYDVRWSEGIGNGGSV